MTVFKALSVGVGYIVSMLVMFFTTALAVHQPNPLTIMSSLASIFGWLAYIGYITGYKAR